MIEITPKDIDRKLKEILIESQEDNKLKFKLNSLTKYALGNAALLYTSSILLKYATDNQYDDIQSMIFGAGLAGIIAFKKLKNEFDNVVFVDEFCKRRGLKREDYRDFELELSYKEELLNKTIKNFDIPKENQSKKRKM